MFILAECLRTDSLSPALNLAFSASSARTARAVTTNAVIAKPRVNETILEFFIFIISCSFSAIKKSSRTELQSMGANPEITGQVTRFQNECLDTYPEKIRRKREAR